MSKLDDDITEIEAFLTKLRFSSNIDNSEQTRASFKSAYKQFHALLVWGTIAESHLTGHASARIYFRETLSDVSHALVLTLLNLYKPARTSLRSGIENFFRALLLIRNIDATRIRNVYELFDQVEDSFSKESLVASNIHKLRATYGDLCKTVHSTKIDYMSLSIPFERLNDFHSSRFNSNLVVIRSAITAANQVIFCLWHEELKKAGRSNDDFVRDAIPRSLKRAISNATRS